jgi:membrane protease YdiL (CAAX protease family)
MADEIAIATEARPPSLARRILHFPLTLMLIAILFFAAGSVLANRLLRLVPSHPDSPWLLTNAAIVILCLAAAFWIFCRFVDREAGGLFGRRGWAKELLAGLAAGSLIFASVVGAAAALGYYRTAGSSGLETIWQPLAVEGLIAGFSEELLFRGILFRYIEKAGGSWVALALTSALFGLAHIANPGATWFSSLCIAVEAGILLGAVYMLTRRLWAAMGLHAAWNFTQGWIFGLPVSGMTGGVGLLNGRLTGPELMTGGPFGLEASLPALVVATAAGVGILAVAVRRGQIVAPMWSRARLSAPAAAPPDAQSHTSPS